MNATLFFDWGFENKKYKEKLREKVTNLFKTASFSFNSGNTGFYNAEAVEPTVKRQNSAENEIFYTVDYLLKEGGRVYYSNPSCKFTFTESVEFLKSAKTMIMFDDRILTPEKCIRDNVLSFYFFEYRPKNNHFDIRIKYNI